MSFSYSAGVITQTGTDTSLAGLSGLTGVTVQTSGQTVYSLSGARLKVDGTLSWEASSERVKFVSPTSGSNIYMIEVSGTGTMTVTSQLTDQKDFYHGIDFGSFTIGFGITTREAMRIRSGGTVTISGMTTAKLGTAGGRAIAVDGTLNLNDCKMIQYGTSNSAQIDGSGTINCDNAELRRYVVNSPQLISGTWDAFSFYECQEAIVVNPGASSEGSFSMANFDTGTITSYLSRSRTTSGKTAYTLTSVKDGNNYSHTLDSPGTGTHYLFLKQEVNYTFVDAAGSALSTKVYGKDVDNGSRFANDTVDSVPHNYFADQIYSNTGTTASFDVLYEARKDATGTHSNTTTWATVDYRGTSGGKIVPFGAYTYGYTPVSVPAYTILPNADAVKVFSIVDTLITQTTKATVDAYLTADDAQEGYDSIASQLEDDYLGETDTIVGRSGDALVSKGNGDLTIDSAAAAVRAYSGNDITLKSTNSSHGFDNDGGTGKMIVQGATIMTGNSVTGDLDYSSSATTLTNVTVTGTLTLSAGTYVLDGCTINDLNNSGSVTVRAVNSTITTNSGTASIEYYSAISHTVKDGATPKSGAIVGYWDDTDTDRTYSSSFVQGALTSDGSGNIAGYVRYRLDATTYTGITCHTGLAAYLKYEVPVTPTGAAISSDILLTADAYYTATPSTGTTINFGTSTITQAGNATTQGIYDYYIQQWYTATNLFNSQIYEGVGATFAFCCTFTLSSGTLSGDTLSVDSGATLNVNGGSLTAGVNIIGDANAVNLTVLNSTINMQGGTIDLADLTSEQRSGDFASGTIDLDSLSTPTTTTLDLRSVSNLGAGLTIKNDSNEDITVKILPSQTAPTLDVTGPGTGTLTVDNSPNVANSNILVDSYCRLYNVTQATELDLQTLAGAGYSYDVSIGTGAGLAQVGDTLRLDVALYRTDGTVYKIITESAVLSDTGITYTSSQSVWTNIETIHSKGTTYEGPNVTGFSLDVPNIEVDSSLTEISGWKLATWLYYQVSTTTDGMRNYYDAFNDLNLFNFEVDSAQVNLKVDNTGAPATWIDASWTRSDGASIVSTSSATIQFANGLINVVVPTDTEPDVNVTQVNGTAVSSINDFRAKATKAL